MFPLRDDQHPNRLPVGTWALILLNAAVFLFQLGLPEGVLQRFYQLYGVIPARFTNPEWAWFQGFPGDVWLTLITSMFIHGGWLHLLANLWTLRLFGDDVEDRLGTGRFLALYFLAGVAAGSMQIFLFPDTTIPTIGASGAVAGVMGAFLLLFPRARIEVLVPLILFLDIWSIPALFYLPIWFLGELLWGTLALAVPTFSEVAFWAHIGGFLMGMGVVTLLVHLVPRLGAEPRLVTTGPVVCGPGFILLSRERGGPCFRPANLNEKIHLNKEFPHGTHHWN